MGLILGQSGAAALAYLAEAASFARELDRDPWDFAVEIQTFRDLGLTNNDFRWLLCQGLVEHQAGNNSSWRYVPCLSTRPPFEFLREACFVLSDEGLVNARAETGFF